MDGKTLKSLIRGGSIKPRRLSEYVCRFAFAFQAIEHLRPFLGPFYAWIASVALDSFHEIPKGLLVIARFLASQLRGDLLEEVLDTEGHHPTQSIILSGDAWAERNDVQVGGWRPSSDGSTTKAPWFTRKLTRQNAPWAFGAGEPFRRIASLELFTTLLCVLLLAPKSSDSKEVRLKLVSETDNLGNAQLVSKIMTTRFPLVALLAELSVQAKLRSAALEVGWVPRLQNIESDELSNNITTRFDPECQVKVDLEDLNFVILPELLHFGAALYESIGKEKAGNKRPEAQEGQNRSGKRRPQDRLRFTDLW